ncbi:MAG: hypothetical protein RL441_1036 [Actinomycetota bacterium]
MTKSVLLVTSNGWGLGHLIRQLTISKYLPSDIRCTILTLSQAAHVAASDNLEYAPSYTQPWITKAQWHGGYLRDRIVALAEEVNAEIIVFDGVVPYIGLLDALRHLEVTRVWMRRGLWRTDADTSPLNASRWFDLIIEPSDIGDSHDVGPTSTRRDATKVGVITDAGANIGLSREQAAARLGCDPARKTLLINIGSSAIGDLSALTEVLAEHPDWQILTTKDSLGRSRHVGDDEVIAISGVFPLYPYLSAIDLAVTSVGYNAAHEFIGMGVPAIYVPAPTTTDDQFARAEAIAGQGAGWAVTSQDPQALAQVLNLVLSDDEHRESVRLDACAVRDAWSNGAEQAAGLIVSAHRARTRDTALDRLKIALRVEVELLVGNLLRRTHRKAHREYVLTRELTPALMGAETPLEHMLPTSSEEYSGHRSRLAKEWLLS